MKIPAVIDTTILIGFERIGRLELIPALIDPVLVTQTVIAEYGGNHDWFTEESPADGNLLRALELTLDPGEASAIALAVEKSCRVILDDRKARVVADEMGIAYTGTVGMILKAKSGGLIERVSPVFEELENVGFHLSDPLRDEALRIAGECQGK